MVLKGPDYITSDVLVVGGGGAGLRAGNLTTFLKQIPLSLTWM